MFYRNIYLYSRTDDCTYLKILNENKFHLSKNSPPPWNPNNFNRFHLGQSIGYFFFFFPELVNSTCCASYLALRGVTVRQYQYSIYRSLGDRHVSPILTQTISILLYTTGGVEIGPSTAPRRAPEHRQKTFENTLNYTFFRNVTCVHGNISEGTTHTLF